MLEFIHEEVSGNLVAHSETVPFRTYWIDVDSAWTYLTVVQGDRAGANIGPTDTYNSVEEAIAAANEMESSDD